jgi:hypothetical protein
MIETIDSLIEMALDFSEFSVKDPHDPEFHSTMVGQRVTVYLPIRTDQFWDAVTNGVQTQGLTAGADRWKTDIFLDQMEASDKAHSLAGQHGDKAMVLVAEKKIVKPLKTKDLTSEIAFKSGAIKAHLVDAFIHPQDIIAVNYPAKGHSFDIPIREFVRKAKMGFYEPNIPAQNVKGLKHGTATPPPWQYVVLRRVQDLLNYSSNYYNYLLGEPQNDLATAVLREATKLGLPAMYQWTGEDFMKWIYSILPPAVDDPDTTMEDDLAQIRHATEHEGGMRPFYQVYDKFKDEMNYEVRAGKREAPTPHDEG